MGLHPGTAPAVLPLQKQGQNPTSGLRSVGPLETWPTVSSNRGGKIVCWEKEKEEKQRETDESITIETEESIVPTILHPDNTQPQTYSSPPQPSKSGGGDIHSLALLFTIPPPPPAPPDVKSVEETSAGMAAAALRSEEEAGGGVPSRVGGDRVGGTLSRAPTRVLAC